MPAMRRLLAILAMLVGPFGGTRAAADEDEMAMSFEVDRERTKRDKILIASLGGGALLVGGIGLLFHLDSRDLSDAISASGRHTGLTYTHDTDDTRRAALRSRAFTIASYGLGGGLLVATLVAYILTDPGTETITLDGEGARPPVAIEPIVGGAVGTASWTF
jgi:hypothetical protein